MKKLLSLTLVLALALSVFSFTAASAETKDTLVVVPYTRTENMDPYTSFDMDKIVSRQLFNSLWRYDENGVGTACLAESWEETDDGHSITCYLRKDVTFSDGAPFTADDVVFTYEVAAASPTMGYTTTTVISKVEKIDDYTVKLWKYAPFSSVEEFCVEYLPIVSKSSYGSEDFATNPIGTGAYVLERYDAATNYVYLTARDDYFEGTPAIKHVEVRVPLESAVSLVALENGEVDLVGPSISRDDAAIAESEGFVVENGTGWGAETMLLFGEPYTSDQNLRLAICHAINRENAALYMGVMDGIAIQDYYAAKLAGDYAGTMQALQYDPEKAAEYLAASNYNGETLVINVDSTYANMATSAQADLAAIGIKTEINQIDINTWSDLIMNGTLGISFSNYGVAYASPNEMMGYFANNGYYQALGNTTSTDELDAELNACATAWDADELREHTIKAMELSRDLGYVCPLYESSMPFVHTASLQGCQSVWAGTYNYYFWMCSFAE